MLKPGSHLYYLKGSRISLTPRQIAGVSTTVENSSFKTVEALATRVAREALLDFPVVRELTVRIEKPSAYAWVEGVGCEVTMVQERVGMGLK